MGRGPRYRATRIGHKICTKCVTEKLFSEFVPNSKTRSGLGSWCRDCVQEYQRLARRTDYVVNRHASRQRAYYLTHRMECIARSSAWKKLHPDRVAVHAQNARNRLLAALARRQGSDVLVKE